MINIKIKLNNKFKRSKHKHNKIKVSDNKMKRTILSAQSNF